MSTVRSLPKSSASHWQSPSFWPRALQTASQGAARDHHVGTDDGHIACTRLLPGWMLGWFAHANLAY